VTKLKHVKIEAADCKGAYIVLPTDIGSAGRTVHINKFAYTMCVRCKQWFHHRQDKARKYCSRRCFYADRGNVIKMAAGEK